MKLTTTPRRWLLTIHILFAAIMFGNMITFIILNITAVSTTNKPLMEGCFQIMHLLARTSVRVSTIATAITGIMLSVWTKWRFFQFYWIMLKEGFTIILFVLNGWGLYIWTARLLEQFERTRNHIDIFLLHVDIWTGVVSQVILLILIFAISVFKPWGRRKAIVK